jgi:hypothetical protein
MTTRTERLLILAAFVFFSTLLFGGTGLVWLAYSFLSPDSSRNRTAALETTRKWGRLDPMPVSAQQLTVSTHGSAHLPME